MTKAKDQVTAQLLDLFQNTARQVRELEDRVLTLESESVMPASTIDARIEEAAEKIYVKEQAEKRAVILKRERVTKAANEVRAIRRARHNKQ